MATKYFGQFLLERDVIDREALLAGVERQKSVTIPLCALAVTHDCLSREQMQELDAARRTSSDRTFMEMAIRGGMLAFSRLEELSRIRAPRWFFLGDALVTQGRFGLARLRELLDEYGREHCPAGGGAAQIEAPTCDNDVVSAFVETTTDIFFHYTRQLVKVASRDRTRARTDDLTYVFSQKVLGDREFCYALVVSEELARSVANAMLNEQHREMDAAVLDAVMEFVNVVIGNGCTRLNMKDYTITADTPQVVLRQMIGSLVPENVVTVNMESGKGDFDVAFFFPDENGQLPKALI